MHKRLLLIAGIGTLAVGLTLFTAFSTVSAQTAARATAAARVAIPTPILPPTIAPPPNQTCVPTTGGTAMGRATTIPGAGCGYPLPTARPTTGSFAQGVPAITPRLVVADALTPAFSEADVRQYIATNPPRGKVSAQGSVSVASVRFQPTGQVAAGLRDGLRDGLSLPADALVCVAEIKGNFTYSAPPRVNPDGSYSPNLRSISTVYYVFDAKSGNLIQTIYER